MGIGESSTGHPAAVILAAGASRRMGSPKALLDLGGQPLIRHVVKTLNQLRNVDPIMIVTGHQPELIHKALEGQNVTFAHNAGYDSGQMLSSVKTGVAAVEGKADAFFLVLLDQPLVRADTLDAMWQAWQHDRPPILAPAYHGRNGHPILIADRCIAGILSLPAGGSLHDFVEQHRRQMQVIEVNDAGVVSDLDTPDDYQTILRLWQERSGPIAES